LGVTGIRDAFVFKGKTMTARAFSVQTKPFVVCLMLLAALGLLSSCSTHDAKNHPVVSCAPPSEPSQPDLAYIEVNYQYPLAAVCNPQLYVYKSKRRLLLVQDRVLIRDYRIGLGPSPAGDKVFQGDGRTPEGDFYVCVKNPTSNFYKSLGLSYPEKRHAERALVAGNISADEFAKIVQAVNNRNRPPWDTVLGGAIFLHGGGAFGDWTKGCVALNNSDIDELFKIVNVGTPVHILP
jgi:hypothetical protein